MSRFHLGHSSPALAVSMIALIVALGGTSYAAFTLPNNSVGAKQLKNGAVGTFKLKNAAVTNAKLRNGAVTSSKIANGAITGAALNLASLGTVPSADGANHARSADTATKATDATNATNADHAITANTANTATNASSADNSKNADALGGQPPSAFKVVCPSDTTLAGGECVETSDRSPVSLDIALINCGRAGRRLASMGELFALGMTNGTAMTAEDWTDSEYFAVTAKGGDPSSVGMTTQVNSNDGSSSAAITGGVSVSDSHPYRCVTGPSNPS